SQATTFAYNERGWMKNSTSDQFSMELKYNDGTLAQFNGNISGQSYTNGTANTFSYSYDRLNRLTNATAGNNLGEAISYDIMGNIASLTRDGFSTNSYTGYDGNRLTAINGFINSSYGYDANGNLTSDSQKNITLGYNFLNLPQTISGSQNLSYTYSAAGEKLQKQAGGTTTNYIDGIQYTNNSIDFIQTEEGIARNSSGNYSYEYNLSDHLGNIRVTFYKNPNTNQLEVLQRDDYYAFGLRKVATGGTNKYLYNGKELQEELGQYDYGARFYDPVIGRWNVVDPLAESDRMTTPYAYAFDNPIRHTDPDGMFGEDVVEDLDGPKPKPKQTASVPGVLTVGGTILKTLATAIEGVEIVGTAVSTAVAGVVVGVFLPQNGNDSGVDDINNWNLKPVLPPPIIPKSAEKETKVDKSVKNKLEPDKDAEGDHSALKRDKDGKITGTATYERNTKNPTGWDEKKRVDVEGKPHYDKKSGKSIPTPHVKEGKNVRPAKPDELPKQ
ncbi:RHS repeat-associated protein, partial [Pedobacter sp. AK013]|uniref:RHS repeat domain-containing protein n=1 Tax=Pedobacter sp. AK013 TaxID=2723071 RepID=UPI00179932B5